MKETAAPSLVTQIEAAITTLREKRQEIRQLASQAAQLAASGDIEGSIRAEERAAAVTKFCTRQRANIEALILSRKKEQYEEHCRLVDALYKKKCAEAEAVAAQLREAGAEVYDAIQRMAKIGSGDLSGDALLKSTPRSDFQAEVRAVLSFTLTGLGRAAIAMKQHAGSSGFFPSGNVYDSMMFSALRQELPDLVFDAFEIPEEAEPEAVAGSYETH
jgi:hypothetical protein